MDLLDYMNLYHDILKEDTIKDIFLMIVKGLQHCHSNNVMHRDLKPENILVNVDEDGNIYDLRLADFG